MSLFGNFGLDYFHDKRMRDQGYDRQVRDDLRNREWFIKDRDHERALYDKDYKQSRDNFISDRDTDYARQQEFDQGRLKRLMAGAKDVGIHPLAAIGVSPSSGVSSISHSSPAYQGRQHNPSQTNSGSGSNASLGGTPRASQAQIDNLNAHTELMKEQAADSRNKRAMATLNTQQDDQHDLVNPQITKHIDMGGRITTNKNFSDAATLEDRHGEIVGAIAGAVNVPADAYSTVKKAIKDFMEKYNFTRNYGITEK